MKPTSASARPEPAVDLRGRNRLRSFARWLSSDDFAALPLLFLVLGCPLGLLFAIFTPPLQVADEWRHFYRAFAVSDGACIAPAPQLIPLAVDQLSTLFPPRLEQVRRVRFREYGKLIGAGSMSGDQVIVSNPSANIYSCAPYLASALGIGLAKLVVASAIGALYSARLANLSIFLVAVYLALRLLPFGRPLLFSLALMPMTLHQAASASGDALTIASSFLFFGYVLYLAFDLRLRAVSKRHLALLGILLLFTTQCKFNPWFVLLLLVIPASRFGRQCRKKLLLIGIVSGLVIILSAGWQAGNRAHIQFFEIARINDGISVGDNVSFILHRPGRFLNALAHTLGSPRSEYGYASSFVGVMGWFSVLLSPLVVTVYVGFLLAVAVLGGTPIRISLTDRLICAAIVLGSFVSTFALLWAFETSGTCLAREITGQSPCFMPGVQGRYFIPFAPACLLIVSNTRVRLNAGLLTVACIGITSLSGAIALADIYQSYYG